MLPFKPHRVQSVKSTSVVGHVKRIYGSDNGTMDPIVFSGTNIVHWTVMASFTRDNRLPYVNRSRLLFAISYLYNRLIVRRYRATQGML